jgi:hypothetical protein
MLVSCRARRSASSRPAAHSAGAGVPRCGCNGGNPRTSLAVHERPIRSRGGCRYGNRGPKLEDRIKATVAAESRSSGKDRPGAVEADRRTTVAASGNVNTISADASNTSAARFRRSRLRSQSISPEVNHRASRRGSAAGFWLAIGEYRWVDRPLFGEPQGAAENVTVARFVRQSEQRSIVTPPESPSLGGGLR